MTTNELLRRYLAEKSEPAFAELLRRHIDLVYSAALRQMNGDSAAAQDVTQKVFIDLARKAPRLVRHTSLTGWLYTSARYLAGNARRTERRRLLREQQAHTMNQLLQPAGPDTVWDELRPVLDAVMHQLGAADREAVLLRYFEGLPLAEVGAKLNLTENAARMKVDRALDKLRAALAKRGVNSTAASLAGVLTERAVGAAPAGLAFQISRTTFRLCAATGIGAFLGFLLNFAAPSKAGLLIAATAGILLVCWPKLRVRIDTFGVKTGARAGSTSLPAALNDNTTSGSSKLSAAIWPASTNKLLLRIVAADSGLPVPMVEIEAVLWNDANQLHQTFVSTRFGVCEVPVPRTTTTALWLWARMDGFADTWLLWKMDRGDIIPSEYILGLARAALIGGRVLDADGQPVAGASVRISVPGNAHPDDAHPEAHAFGSFETFADARGRWSVSRIAPELFPRGSAEADHPKYLREEESILDSSKVRKQMLDGSYVFHLDRALSIHGVISDPDDRPIAQARIEAYPELPGLHGEKRATSSQADGSFTLRGLIAGGQLIAVEADGFVQTNLDIYFHENSLPLRLALRRGRLLRLRVVDQQGLPVPNATALFEMTPRRSGPAQFYSTVGRQTDSGGRVEWNGAPDERLTFIVQASGFEILKRFKVFPDGEERIIILPPGEPARREPSYIHPRRSPTAISPFFIQSNCFSDDFP